MDALRLARPHGVFEPKPREPTFVFPIEDDPCALDLGFGDKSSEGTSIPTAAGGENWGTWTGEIWQAPRQT